MHRQKKMAVKNFFLQKAALDRRFFPFRNSTFLKKNLFCLSLIKKFEKFGPKKFKQAIGITF